jgi:hypothetical protein
MYNLQIEDGGITLSNDKSETYFEFEKITLKYVFHYLEKDKDKQYRYYVKASDTDFEVSYEDYKKLHLKIIDNL